MATDTRVSHGLAEGEKLVQCPYDSSHWILGQRMDRHILRCRHNYEKKLKEKGEELNKVTCAYHPMHFCVDVELNYHQDQCPYKFKDYKQELADLRALVPKRTDEDKAHAEFTRKVSEDELWEDEDLNGKCEARVYPKPPKADRVSFFVPKGLSKSDRKAFRQALIERNNSIVDKTFVKVRSIDEGTEICLDAEKLKIAIENQFKTSPSELHTEDNLSEDAVQDAPEDCKEKLSTEEMSENSNASVATSADVEPENFLMAETASVAGPIEDEDDEDDEFWDARSAFSAFSLTK